LLSNGNYGLSQDVWAAGCTLSELLIRRPLFPGTRSDNIALLVAFLRYLTTGTSKKNQLERIFRVFGYRHNMDFINSSIGMKTFLDLQQEHSPNGLGLHAVVMNRVLMDARTYDLFLNLLSEMLQVNPSNRITCKQALSHPLFLRESPSVFYSELHNMLSLDDINDAASNRRALIRLLHEEIHRFKLLYDPTHLNDGAKVQVTPDNATTSGTSYPRLEASDYLSSNTLNTSSKDHVIDMMDVSEEDNVIASRISKPPHDQMIGIAMSGIFADEPSHNDQDFQSKDKQIPG
jgi:serine/threonine protein kinase